MKDSKLVYSTSGPNTCSSCGKPLRKCRCNNAATPAAQSSQTSVLIQLQRKGRGGKDVTQVSGLTLPAMEMLTLLQELKTTLGSGGTLKQQTLEIQGNHVQNIKALLASRGIHAKVSGG